MTAKRYHFWRCPHCAQINVSKFGHVKCKRCDYEVELQPRPDDPDYDTKEHKDEAKS